MKRVLYLSYDGMTDPLGQSQVIPYVSRLGPLIGARFTIVSFEKRDRADRIPAVRDQLAALSIDWVPLSYTKRPPVISTVYDVVRLLRTARRLHREDAVAVTHCRSYIAAVVGRRMARRARVPFIFDMRGFWVDERIDAGLWPQRRLLYRTVARWFRKTERRLLTESAATVVLTHRAVDVISAWPGSDRFTKVDVIPCCVDLELFDLRAVAGSGPQTRAELGVADDVAIVGYLGSLGTWYLLDEMMAFCTVYLRRHSDAVAVFLTTQPVSLVAEAAARAGVPWESIRVKAVEYSDVPRYVSTFSLSVSFIRATPSKLGSSPTKLAELLAMNVPVVANAGIGDVDDLLACTGGLIEVLDDAAYGDAIDRVEARSDRTSLRELVATDHSIDEGVRRYTAIYQRLGV